MLFLSHSIPKTVKEDDHDAGARNPMLYDPLTENNVKTTKVMQYVATLVGQFLCFDAFSLILIRKVFSVCLGAISAGTALAWSSPVLPQMTAPNYTTSGNSTAQNHTAVDGELYLTPEQSECFDFSFTQYALSVVFSSL